MKAICGWYGISRQAHYQQVKRDERRAEQAEEVIAMVQEKRRKHPRMGGRKLLHELRPKLAAAGIEMGRDRFFDLLRQAGLLVPHRRSGRRTTWAGGWFSQNLLAETVLTGPNQAWVSDITYVETEDGFGYLCLITDAFSRCIVGFDFSRSLAVEGVQRALKMALHQAGPRLEETIFHSDHGIQYTCHAFRKQLADNQMRSSMGQVGNCYDNALAERVNGILKQEYALGGRFVNFRQAHRAVREAIWLYNHERPHLSLGYNKPINVHHHVAVMAHS